MSNRRFYRRIFEVEVLSETPIPESSLEEIAYQVRDGDWSGSVNARDCEAYDGATMARMLTAQGSDPSFFCLDENGNDTDQ